MCGRYALALRPAEVRRQLQEAHMPCDEAPGDDEVRQSYNFAPGYHGLVYRAAVPDTGAGPAEERDGKQGSHSTERAAQKPDGSATGQGSQETKYKLQAMQWGLVPFWTKRNPDYGSKLKTINCRDDSLMRDGGMWNTMKQKKRCIVVCQGFYEWQKKNGGKVPHFVRRKDGRLMCMAGLWDCAQFDGAKEKLYTYTVITTNSNKQLQFLHDRMPVILDNGSDAIRTWLDPNRAGWSKELQSLLKPYEGELEIYPVAKEVGKVGNNSPTFIVPLDSAENKSNIANFFGSQKRAAKGKEEAKAVEETEADVKQEGTDVKHEPGETRATTNESGTEDNAPLPTSEHGEEQKGIKREHGADDDDDDDAAGSPPKHKLQKTSPAGAERSAAKPARRSRSATSNGTVAKTPDKAAADGSKKITAFFAK